MIFTAADKTLSSQTVAPEKDQRDAWTALGHSREPGYSKAGKYCVVFLASILLAACASISHRPAEIQTYDYAHVLFERGSYEDAHDAYRYLAETYPASPMTEEAEFKAAYILVYYKNPDRDYDRAQREFSEFLQRYPSSTLSGQAQSWIAVLKSFDQGKTHEFMVEVESLSKKNSDLWREIENRQAAENELAKERDSLRMEKEDLSKKADDLLKEKERLLGEKAVVISERDGLEQDKIALQKKVAALTGEKDALIKAKKKLEKSLHDLTMVDVKMEKKRKRIKEEETTKNTGSAPR